MPQRFRITHPFHPRFGQEFELESYRNNWGEDRVYFFDAEQRLVTIPARWTNVVGQDPLVTLAAGRSYFRVEDLLGLAQLIAQLKMAPRKTNATGV